MCDAPQCGSFRIISYSAKCADRCFTSFNGDDRHNYPPYIPDVSKGDYVTFDLCLECGKVQGNFPKDDPEEFVSDDEQWY